MPAFSNSDPDINSLQYTIQILFLVAAKIFQQILNVYVLDLLHSVKKFYCCIFLSNLHKKITVNLHNLMHKTQ